MQLNTLKSKTKRITSPRIGRGGKRGKTSGRGTKGQKSRAGHKIRPEIRDIMRRFPKRRGYGKNRGLTHVPRKDMIVINVSLIEKFFDNGAIVSPTTLAEKGIVSNRQSVARSIKVLAGGDIQKKVTVKGCVVSPSARDKIVKAGGIVE